MKLAIIVAMGRNREIGNRGSLPWPSFPADMKHFRALTMGHPIIMGRKTFESIGKALPGRMNIVLSSQRLRYPNITDAGGLSEAFIRAEDSGAKKAFVIGGAGVYKEALSKADEIHATLIYEAFSADVYFPEIDALVWREIFSEYHPPDRSFPYPYAFRTFQIDWKDVV